MILITRETIAEWFDEGKDVGLHYMLIVYDDYNSDHYPVFTHTDNYHDEYKKFDNVKMQKVIEVYDLSKDRDEQLDMQLCFNAPVKS